VGNVALFLTRTRTLTFKFCKRAGPGLPACEIVSIERSF